MPRSQSPFYVHSAQKVRTLASPVRAAIVDILEALGAATVVDLGTTLGYPPDGLYYHLSLLERHGLVVRVKPERGTGAARFDVPGRPIKLRYHLGDRPQRRATGKVMATMLRSAERSFRRALAPGLATVQGPRRNLWAGRRTAWLTDRELESLNRHLGRIHALFGRRIRRRAGGRLHEFTFVLAPILEQGRRAGTDIHQRGVRT